MGDEARRGLIAVLRARMRQQAQRGALLSLLGKRATHLQHEHDEAVEFYVQRHRPAARPGRPWWKFWAGR